MANQSKLKAWVRYDGTGRVISGGPIFQVNKPKVGNWRQIDANLCCNGNTPTTTTTTTSGGGGTPTAFIQSYYFNTYNACNSTTDGQFVVYSASSTLSAGSTVFVDAGLNFPVIPGYVIASPEMFATKYLVGEGGILSENVCVYPFQSGYSYSNRSEACEVINYATIFAAVPVLQNGVPIYTDNTLSTPAPYSFVASGGNSYYLSNNALQGSETCSIPSNSQSALAAFNPQDACAGIGTSITVYYTGNLEVNTLLYLDSVLTIPYNPYAYGGYIKIYFAAQDQVCTISGNTLASYTAC